MKKINSTYVDSLISKVLNETLEEKADKLVSKLKGDLKELGGMDDSHPTFGKLNFANMTDEEIEDLMKKTLPSGFDKEKDEEETEEMTEGMDGECSECGGMMREGECSECGYNNESIYHRSEDDLPPTIEDVEEDIYDVSKGFPKTKSGKPATQEFDYVGEEMSEESEEDMENDEFCKYQLDNFGPDDERFKEKCKTMSESLKGGQKKLDKNKNGKIDAEDFKLLRKNKKKGGETDEQWQALAADMAVAAAPAVATWALDKAFGESNESKKKFPDLSGDGKVTRKDVLLGRGVKLKDKGKGKVSESLTMTEDELVDLIEKIIKEQKAGLKTIGKPKGLTKYEQVHKADGKENQEYLKSVAKKMKEYLKDGSKGEYETNPKHFPKGNGELGEMKKKAYKASDAVKDYVDNFTAAGLENLNYDEIEPNEDWVSDNVKGSSRTGNNQKWGNAVETDVNKKRDEIRKKNLLGQIKKKAYNKATQPISRDKAGENEGDKIMAKLESVEPKTEKKLNEEFNKMKHLITYNQKTQ